MFFIFLLFYFRTGILLSCSTRTVSSMALVWMLLTLEMVTLVTPASWPRAGSQAPGSASTPRPPPNSRSCGSRARTTGRAATGWEAKMWRRHTESRKKISKGLWSKVWSRKLNRNIHIFIDNNCENCHDQLFDLAKTDSWDPRYI